MKEIQLTQGYVALVDDEDFERVNQFNWQCIVRGNCIYAKRGISKNGVTSTQYMQNFIMGIENSRVTGIEVDHIFHNGLDNQKKNLRVCTSSQNNMNRRKNKNGTSKYKGVSWNKRGNKWISVIYYNKKRIYIGDFKSEITAAIQYDNKAKVIFGDFAYLNFP